MTGRWEGVRAGPPGRLEDKDKKLKNASATENTEPQEQMGQDARGEESKME